MSDPKLPRPFGKIYDKPWQAPSYLAVCKNEKYSKKEAQMKWWAMPDYHCLAVVKSHDGLYIGTAVLTARKIIDWDSGKEVCFSFIF